MGRFLFVGLDTGGTWKPMLGLARMMVRAGHVVAVLGSPSMRATSEQAGCDFLALSADLDEMPGRALEDDDFEAWSIKVCGLPVALALAPAVERFDADVLVVDFLQFNALSAAELLDLPLASVVHLGLADWGDGDGWDWVLEPLNETRAALGLSELTERGGIAALWRQPRVALSLLPAQWSPTPTPDNVVTVGPIAAARRDHRRVELPWIAHDARPLVVISMSSTYMRQELLLSRVATTASQLPVRVLLSLAGAVAAGDVPVPESVVVRDWVEFDDILPLADVLVSHGGMATTSAGLAHGVPLLLLPQGRDQDDNAQKVVDTGAGIVLPPNSPSNSIQNALQTLLTQPGYAQAAQRFATALQALGGGRLAIAELEKLAGNS